MCVDKNKGRNGERSFPTKGLRTKARKVANRLSRRLAKAATR